MKSLLLAAPALLLFSGTASAQQASPYDCQNVAARVDVPAQSMAMALDALTRQTHCPISREVDISTLRSTAVKGRMRPAEAIVALVRGSGLEAMPVKEGLMIGRFDQKEIAARADALDGRIRARQAAGRLSSANAAMLRRSLGQVRRQVTTLARQQGFVSAAEKASFGRTFRTVEARLGA